MYETNYHRAGSVTEAVTLVTKSEDGKFLGGGQTMLPTMKQRLASVSDLVDVTKISELNGICEGNGTISIGAATTHAEVAASAIVKQKLSCLAELAGGIGDPAVRNMGTLGGSVANNDPAADYPAALVALNATVITNRRELSAEDFFIGMFETALEDDEIILSVTFPLVEKGAYSKFPNPASRYAMAGVFVARHLDGSVRVAVTGAGNDGVFRADGIEAALERSWSPEAVTDIGIDPANMLSDMHGSSGYRANLVSVMAKRAIAAAA